MRIRLGIWLVAFPLLASHAGAGEIDDALASIKAVKREGAGNADAAAGWKTLVKAGPAALVPVLTAFDRADAIAANWLRAAVDAIAEAEINAGRALPIDRLDAFVRDNKRDSRARSQALDLLTQADPAAKDRLLPRLLDDPAGGVRRAAVAYAIETADKFADSAIDVKEYQRILAAARDVDQVEAIAKKLQAAGAAPDLPAHFGFVTKWLLRGPFDNKGLKGFAAPLPPLIFPTPRPGTDPPPAPPTGVREFATANSRGVVDLYAAFGKTKGLNKDGAKDAVYALAFVALESAGERPVQIRAGTQNAIKIFLNGQEVFSREEYHHGMKMDQHVAAVTLKKGVNEVLLKICQDEATFNWTFPWAFQMRVTDAIGTPIPLKQLSAASAVPAPEPMKESK